MNWETPAQKVQRMSLFWFRVRILRQIIKAHERRRAQRTGDSL